MAETQTVRRVAVALFEGFTVLDVYGPVQAFVPHQFREMRDREGRLAYPSREDELKTLLSLPLVDIRA